MSAGSAASNLGYSNVDPYNNSPYVNGTSTNNPANFSSNEIPKSSCSFKGGAKKLRKKIKNITKRYKMGGKKNSRKNRKSLRKRLRSNTLSLSLSGGRKRRKTRTNRMKGGYSQYQNNQPFSMGYSLGGILGPNESALATPPPMQSYNSAIDNYNHYTNTGSPSTGH